MPTLERAMVILKGMGGAREIYWDKTHHCYRVMSQWSLSLYRNSDNYLLLKGR